MNLMESNINPFAEQSRAGFLSNLELEGRGPFEEIPNEFHYCLNWSIARRI
jgi:hypothetical protein